MIFNTGTLNSAAKLKCFKNNDHFSFISCQFAPIIPEPIFIDIRKVTKLNQVFVAKLPNKAVARLALAKEAKKTAAIGPVPGNIPVNTPKPKPKATFCGESLVRTNFKYSTPNNLFKRCKFIRKVYPR